MGGDIVEKLAARFIASDLDRAQFLMDPDGTIRSWNPGAQILLGYESGEIGRASCRERV